MSTDKSRHDGTAISATLPPWREANWNGPPVEARSEHAGPDEWPDGAVERVVFTLGEVPTYPYPDELPYTEFFGADGWPLHTPEKVKPRLDTRVQAELRRWPWTIRPQEWNERSWLLAASDYERFMRWNIQAKYSKAIATSFSPRVRG